jgi:uncharacterized protein
MTEQILARQRRATLVAFFILAYATLWAFEIPVALSAHGILKTRVPYGIHYFASFGPMLAPLVVTGFFEGRKAVKRPLGGPLKWRVSFEYLLFSVGVPVAVFGLSVIVGRIIQGSWPDFMLLGRVDYLPYLGLPAALGLWFLTYGLGEEVGWRGFALPRLQRTRSALSASVMLGLLWVFGTCRLSFTGPPTPRWGYS